jgi:hypothetical protein
MADPFDTRLLREILTQIDISNLKADHAFVEKVFNILPLLFCAISSGDLRKRYERISVNAAVECGKFKELLEGCSGFNWSLESLASFIKVFPQLVEHSDYFPHLNSVPVYSESECSRLIVDLIKNKTILFPKMVPKFVNQQVVKAAIDVDPSNIAFVLSPSEGIQLTVIRSNPQNIRFITNPTENVIGEAINLDPTCMTLIKRFPNAFFQEKYEILAKSLILKKLQEEKTMRG